MPSLLVRRIVAYIVDIALLFLALGPVGQLIRLAIGWPAASPTGQEVWLAALLNFSVPTWTYFVLSDSSASGATVGKRLLRIHVTRLGQGRIGPGRALGRTAVKLLPWELTHLSAFALSSVLGLAIANGLLVIYLAVAAYTRGRRSVHDYVAKTEVCRSSA